MSVEATCVNDQGSAIGMPHLCVDWIPHQLFWLVVALIAIYFIMSKVALPRIGSVLAARQGAITSDIAAADEFKQKAAQAEAQYHETLAEAKAEAGRIVLEAKKVFKTQLDEAMSQADVKISAKTAESEAKIADIRAGAMDAVTQVAKDTAKELVAQFDTKADARSINAAVTAHLKV